jgi:hypothetical protein
MKRILRKPLSSLLCGLLWLTSSSFASEPPPNESSEHRTSAFRPTRNSSHWGLRSPGFIQRSLPLPDFTSETDTAPKVVSLDHKKSGQKKVVHFHPATKFEEDDEPSEYVDPSLDDFEPEDGQKTVLLEKSPSPSVVLKPDKGPSPSALQRIPDPHIEALYQQNAEQERDFAEYPGPVASELEQVTALEYQYCTETNIDSIVQPWLSLIRWFNNGS